MAEVRSMRVGILDDYEIVALGLSRMLEEHGVEVVALTHDHAPGGSCEILLYDPLSHGGIGPLIPDVIAAGVADRVAVYSWILDNATVKAALDDGAAGYLAKALPGVELLGCLERIAAGEVVVTEPEGDATDPGDWPGRRQGLTTRESEIIALITQGLSNQQIADRAFLSINSVKSYIRSSYRKMGVSSRSQSVLWSIENGFRPSTGVAAPPATRVTPGGTP